MRFVPRSVLSVVVGVVIGALPAASWAAGQKAILGATVVDVTNGHSIPTPY